MFEKLGHYTHWWMLPMLGLFLAAWLIGGGYLLRASLHKKLAQRRPPRVGQCVLHMFLAGTAAGLAGLVVAYLLYVIGSRADTRLLLPAGLAALLVMPLVAYLMLFGLLNLSARQSLSVALPPVGGLILLTLVLGAAAGIPAIIIRHRERDQNLALRNLLLIHRAAVGSYEPSFGKPPRDLSELVERNYFDAKVLQSPGLPGRQVGFFYLPTPARGKDDPNSRRIFACDMLGSHGGRGRAVVLVSGQPMWLKEKAFQALLDEPDNEQFAEALRAAEAP